MKKKILVAGTNVSIVKDFITHSDLYFHCISTTDCWKDLERHFDIFKPEGYILFPESAEDDMISQINKLKRESCYNNCPVFICATVEICAAIQRSNPRLADLMLKRPVSADNLSLRILKYYEDAEKKKLLEEKQKTIDFVYDENEAKRKKHVLVVDDDRTILKMLKSALEDKYEVTTMVNGVLVEKFLTTKDVDMIILDYEMPVKTGADVIREIKANERAKEVPVCFLTGVDQREKIMEILALKPDAYMLKPVNMEALLATVSNLID
ncbi:MAG: response regulator [Ruminococcus sp.]|nr:response regulator [Ruminococcus sp.]